LHSGAYEIISDCNDQASKATWEQLGDYDIRPELARLKGRFLLVMGADDPYGVETLDSLERALANAETTKIIIPACGHRLLAECPAKTLAVIRDFLARR
jgi:pimeloyl-ACP methyl ester carboxylesterase